MREAGFARLFVPFAAGYFLSYMLRTVNAVISPELTREFHLDAADLGLLTSAYFLSFGAAQIPLGIALDRYGPRRVEAALMLLAAAGCAVFAFGQSVFWLAAGRALIGLGVSACLMAGLKSFTESFAAHRYAALTGAIMAAGSLGAITASVPLERALPLIGWRGVFMAVAILCAAVAALVYLAVPEGRHARDTRPLAQQLAGVREVLRAPRFWLYVPQGLFGTGALMAFQGLWLVPWAMAVDGVSREVAARHLMVANLGLLAGQLLTAGIGTRLVAAGFNAQRMLHAGVAAALIIEAAIIARMGEAMSMWFLWGLALSVTAQVYGLVSAEFPAQLSGRASTAINLMAFVGAFVLQWGFGAAVDAFRPRVTVEADAFRLALAGVAVLQALGLVAMWFKPARENAPAR